MRGVSRWFNLDGICSCDACVCVCVCVLAAIYNQIQTAVSSFYSLNEFRSDQNQVFIVLYCVFLSFFLFLTEHFCSSPVFNESSRLLSHEEFTVTDETVRKSELTEKNKHVSFSAAVTSPPPHTRLSDSHRISVTGRGAEISEYLK